MTRPPDWRLPPGVAPGTWDYVHAPSIADQYESFVRGSQLLHLDAHLVREYLPPPAPDYGTRVADLGCGTGRSLLPLVRRGYRALAIDLSRHMLRHVREAADRERLPIDCLCANLVQLEGVRDAVADHAVCLFSTLGMIRGRAHRRRALAHAARILRPGGRFLLHVHNVWAALRDPGGFAALARSYRLAWSAPENDFGDRIYAYRGLPNMFLHSFSQRELRSDLRRAGFRILHWLPVTRHGDALLRWPRCAPALRAGGYFVVCQV